MIVVMRGLPGSGKSALARALAQRMNAVVLDKDAVRAALFPGSTTEYTTAQDDFVIGLTSQAAGASACTTLTARGIEKDLSVCCKAQSCHDFFAFAASISLVAMSRASRVQVPAHQR